MSWLDRRGTKWQCKQLGGFWIACDQRLIRNAALHVCTDILAVIVMLLSERGCIDYVQMPRKSVTLAVTCSISRISIILLAAKGLAKQISMATCTNLPSNGQPHRQSCLPPVQRLLLDPKRSKKAHEPKAKRRRKGRHDGNPVARAHLFRHQRRQLLDRVQALPHFLLNLPGVVVVADARSQLPPEDLLEHR